MLLEVIELRGVQQWQRQLQGLAPDGIARPEPPVNFIDDAESPKAVRPTDEGQGCRKIHQKASAEISIVLSPTANTLPPDEYGAPKFIIKITRSALEAPPSRW